MLRLRTDIKAPTGAGAPLTPITLAAGFFLNLCLELDLSTFVLLPTAHVNADDPSTRAMTADTVFAGTHSTTDWTNIRWKRF